MTEKQAKSLKVRLFAAFNPDLPFRAPGRLGRVQGLATQFVLVTLAALMYFGARMITKGAESAAFTNARDLLSFEQSLGLDIENWAQSLIVHNRAIVTFFNWVYIWLHWPLILGSLLVLYLFNRRGYVMLRNAMVVSGAIGLIFYVSYPVAPPRFLNGFTDTVHTLSTSYKILQPPSIVNPYAAMPSLHVGWNLLAALILYQALRNTKWRFLPLVSPLLMALAVVFTANHYVIDAFVGAAVALMGLAGAYGLRRASLNYLAKVDPSAVPVTA